MNIQTIDRSGLEQAQKDLLAKRDAERQGSDEQREFIREVWKDPEAFCRRVRSWGVTVGDAPPVPEQVIGESDFVDPPWTTECVVAAAWRELPVSLAARAETWTRIHVEMIERERISSTHLAAPGKGHSGRARIAQALRGSHAAPVEKCVRAILRRLGGVISDRGNRTAFIDCPLARAWWRNRYANEAHGTFQLSSVEALSLTLRQPSRWDPLVEAMISRLTVIGDSRIRPALVQCFADAEGSFPKDTWRVLYWIGRRSTVQALGALEPKHIVKLVIDEFLESWRNPHSPAGREDANQEGTVSA